MTACAFSYNTGVAISGFAPLTAELFASSMDKGFQLLLIIIHLMIFIAFRNLLKTTGYNQAIINGSRL